VRGMALALSMVERMKSVEGTKESEWQFDGWERRAGGKKRRVSRDDRKRSGEERERRTESEGVRLRKVLLGGEHNFLRAHLLRVLDLVLLVGEDGDLSTEGDTEHDGVVTETTC
jgi:hypothetical protein